MSEDAEHILSKAGIISVTADIVAAYIANNSLPPADVLSFIESVHATFTRLQQGTSSAHYDNAPVYSKASSTPTSHGGLHEPAASSYVSRYEPQAEAARGPSRQVNSELSRKAQMRNPANPVDPKTGAILPLEFEELVPDEEGFVFDVAWIDSNAHVPFPPMTPIEKTVKRDSIVCLENGKKLKVLKRHLATEYGMTLETYRRKWGLSEAYPLVTHTFSTSRSKYAKAQGLGKTRGRA